MLAIRLPQSVEKRLAKLARRTGRTKTYHARDAILEYLNDLLSLSESPSKEHTALPRMGAGDSLGPSGQGAGHAVAGLVEAHNGDGVGHRIVVQENTFLLASSTVTPEEFSSPEKTPNRVLLTGRTAYPELA